MKVQSLSIVVPTNKCINNCPFCVSKTHESNYDNMISNHLFKSDYIARLEYARDLGTNTIILTGTGEALQNKSFLNDFAYFNKSLQKPFYNIELQTTGVLLDDKTLKWLRETINVKTISLSVSNLFDDKDNLSIIGVHHKLTFNLMELSSKIKSYGFNLRISLNVLDIIESELDFGRGEHHIYDFSRIFTKLSYMGVDQITFRKMWMSKYNDKIYNWIKDNTKNTERFFNKLSTYLETNGRFLNKLPFGALQYSLNQISTVIDDDCMDDKTDKEELKYLILRENAKLYSKWDDQGSLIF